MTLPLKSRIPWSGKNFLALCALLLTACAGTPERDAGVAMVTGENTTAPFGYIAFCARHPEDCLPEKSLQSDVSLNPQKWADLNTVNTFVNITVDPRTDAELYRSYEFWTYPSTGPEAAGDCEDYVLLKRKMLIERGWPAQALLISVALEKDGRAHALLIAVTDKGDYVLDNQTDVILPWDQTPYLWEKRQSTDDPARWVSLRTEMPGQFATAATRRVPRRGHKQRRQGG